MTLISSEGRKGKFTTLVGAATMVAMVGLSACSEKLDSTAGCPTVCGGQTADVQNETFEAVVFDTTVPGTPGLGSEGMMLLASRGDTVDTRFVIRFDTLPSRIRTSATDTTLIPITYVDSTLLTIRFDSSGGAILQPVTVSLYDITTTGNDTAVADLEPLFVPGRLVGQRIFSAGTLIDSVTIPVDNNYIRTRVMTGQPVRLGVRATSSAPVMVRAYSSETSFTPSISFRASPDTALAKVPVRPWSRTPTDNVYAAFSLADFVLIVKGTPPPPAGLLAVGGLPAKRAYFRFNLPSRIVDSSIVVRATLLLTQSGTTGADAADTMRLQPNLVFAGPALTDPVRASQIIAPGSFPLASALTRPEETGVQEIEIAPVFNIWRQQGEALLPRAVVITATREANSGQQVLFYSNSSTVLLRPKLRVSYTTRTRIGTP